MGEPKTTKPPSGKGSTTLRLAKGVASVGGIGFLPGGPGTYASMLYAVVWWGFGLGVAYNLELSFLNATFAPIFREALLVSGTLIWMLLLVGLWSTAKVQPYWGKDPSTVVIDEVLGQAIALFAIPWHPYTVIGALILFRFFDIAKPLGIRRMEKLPGAWGVMLDDVLAGIYANIVLQILWHSGLLGQLTGIRILVP